MGAVTVTFDPRDPRYLDEKDTRDELTRVFEVCRDCRRCVDLCGVFPALFGLVDRLEHRDPGLLTPFEQDRLVDACTLCTACSQACPYTPASSELAIDVPAVVVRARAMRRHHGQVPIRDRLAAMFRRRDRSGSSRAPG